MRTAIAAAHIPIGYTLSHPTVRSTVFKTNRTQAVRLPKQVAFAEGIREVEVIRIGQSRIVSPVGNRWDDLFANGPHTSADFMRERPQPTPEERQPL